MYLEIVPLSGDLFMRMSGALLVLALGTALVPPSLAQSASQLSVRDIVSRMQAAESAEQNRPGYTLLREYRLSGADPNAATSRVLAEVNYIPPASKQFSIRNIEGNDRGEKIVRRVLDHEAEMAKTRAHVAFCNENYDFALLGRELVNGKPAYVLKLSPKQARTELLRGKAWVDAGNFLVVKAEGEPAKSPSWWIKDLNIVITYGRADGVWLPLTTRATADLRLLGTHVLTSKDVEVHAVTESAKLTPAAKQSAARKRSRSAVDQAAVWVPR